MRWSRYYLYTTREVPNDAEVVSHQLMVRAGMIKKVAAGIYSYLPFGWRSLAKLMAIVRRELDAIGAAHPAGGAVAGVRPLAALRQGAPPHQGPPRAGLRLRAHPRGGHYRHHAPRPQELPPAAGQPLPDPDQ